LQNNKKPTLKSLQHELEIIKAQKLLEENKRINENNPNKGIILPINGIFCA
jgi:hypothetical protein